jgi:hypothetical protein
MRSLLRQLLHILLGLLDLVLQGLQLLGSLLRGHRQPGSAAGQIPTALTRLGLVVADCDASAVSAAAQLLHW